MEPCNQQRPSQLETPPRPGRRLSAPLFERLTDPPNPGGNDSKSYRFLDLSRAIESIKRELGRILNTRTILQTADGLLTSREYGLADFAHISAADKQAHAELALRIARIVETFEPRLGQVRVTIEPHPSGQRFLTGTISANVLLNLVPEPVSFPLEMHSIVVPVEAINAAPVQQRI
jgi:type VI secretion system lysozyme-like protein